MVRFVFLVFSRLQPCQKALRPSSRFSRSGLLRRCEERRTRASPSISCSDGWLDEFLPGVFRVKKTWLRKREEDPGSEFLWLSKEIQLSIAKKCLLKLVSMIQHVSFLAHPLVDFLLAILRYFTSLVTLPAGTVDDVR